LTKFRTNRFVVRASACLEAFRAFARDECGASIVAIALSMPVLIGGMGLAAEISYWRLHHRAMQNAADSAAIAAATNAGTTGRRRPVRLSKWQRSNHGGGSQPQHRCRLHSQLLHGRDLRQLTFVSLSNRRLPRQRGWRQSTVDGNYRKFCGDDDQTLQLLHSRADSGHVEA
jgi:Putative Flp pilus-assembly TadE/G-like